MARNLQFVLVAMILSAGSLRAETPKSVDEFAREISKLAYEGKFEQAEALLVDVARTHAQDPEVGSLHTVLHMYYDRAGQHERAAEHMEQYLEHVIKNAAKLKPIVIEFVTLNTSGLKRSYERAGDLEAAKKTIASQLARATTAVAQSDRPSSQLLSVTTNLYLARVKELALSGEKDEAVAVRTAAGTLLDDQIALATKWRDENKGDVDRSLHLGEVMGCRARLADRGILLPWQEYSDFWRELISQHPTETKVISGHAEAAKATVLGIYRLRPKRAAEILSKARAAIEDAKPSTQQVAQQRRDAFRELAGLDRHIERRLKQLRLVNAEFPEFSPNAWVNGEPLSPKDFSDKVVVLHFWSMSLSPSFENFSTLQRWNSSYAENGLLIVGVTNYCSHGWNDLAGGPRFIQGLTKEEERAALQKFADSHGVKHRIAVMNDDSLLRQLKLSDIPMVIVIDKSGKVRIVTEDRSEEMQLEIENDIVKLLDQ